MDILMLLWLFGCAPQPLADDCGAPQNADYLPGVFQDLTQTAGSNVVQVDLRNDRLILTYEGGEIRTYLRQ